MTILGNKTGFLNIFWSIRQKCCQHLISSTRTTDILSLRLGPDRGYQARWQRWWCTDVNFDGITPKCQEQKNCLCLGPAHRCQARWQRRSCADANLDGTTYFHVPILWFFSLGSFNVQQSDSIWSDIYENSVSMRLSLVTSYTAQDGQSTAASTCVRRCCDRGWLSGRAGCDGLEELHSPTKYFFKIIILIGSVAHLTPVISLYWLVICCGQQSMQSGQWQRDDSSG